MKEWLTYIISISIIILFVGNEYIDATTEQAFFDEMRAHHATELKKVQEIRDFMSAGGRNTIEQGLTLCLRVEHLEREHHNIETSSCAEIYKRDQI